MVGPQGLDAQPCRAHVDGTSQSDVSAQLVQLYRGCARILSRWGELLCSDVQLWVVMGHVATQVILLVLGRAVRVSLCVLVVGLPRRCS